MNGTKVKVVKYFHRWIQQTVREIYFIYMIKVWELSFVAGKAIAQVQAAGKEDVDIAVAAARDAFK